MGSAPVGTAAGVDEKPRPPMPPRRAKTAHVTLMSPDSICRLPAGGKGGWKGRGVISVHRPIQAATRNADRGGRSLRSSRKPAASIATNIRKKGAAAPAPPAGRKREVGGGRGRAGCTGRTRLQGAAGGEPSACRGRSLLASTVGLKPWFSEKSLWPVLRPAIEPTERLRSASGGRFHGGSVKTMWANSNSCGPLNPPGLLRRRDKNGDVRERRRLAPEVRQAGRE